MVGVKVTLLEAKMNSDPSELDDPETEDKLVADPAAFRLCAMQAMSTALSTAECLLCEPIMDVTVEGNTTL